MLEGKATIVYSSRHPGPGVLCFELSELETAALAASRYGFHEIDLVDNDAGHYKLVASGHKKTSVTVNGKTLSETVSKLLDIFRE